MKKFFYRITIVLIFLIIIIGIMGTNQISAANFSFNFVGQTEANKGETITLTISANGLTGRVNLSSSNASLSDSQKWVEKNSVSITATINNFPATITATPDELTDNDYNIVDISPITITVNEAPKPEPKPEEKKEQESTPEPPIQIPETPKTVESKPVEVDNRSRNNYLKALSVNVGTLTPEFLPDTSDYEVVFDEGFNLRALTEIEVSAEVEDGSASITGNGTSPLENGENYISIVVTAEQGNYRTYKIKVVKPDKIEESELKLNGLKVYYKDKEGKKTLVKLSSEFSPETYEYKTELPSYVTGLIIEPEMDNKDISIKVEGQDSLKTGKNTILITLVSPDDENLKVEYKIVADVLQEKIVETNIDNIEYKNPNRIVLIASTAIYNGLTILLIAVLITMYVKQDNKKIKEIYEGVDESDLDTNLNNDQNNNKNEHVKKESIFVNDDNYEQDEEKDKKYKGRRFE